MSYPVMRNNNNNSSSSSNRSKIKLPTLTIPPSSNGAPGGISIKTVDTSSGGTGGSNSLIPPPVPHNPGESTPSSAASDLAKSGYFSAELAAAMGVDDTAGASSDVNMGNCDDEPGEYSYTNDGGGLNPTTSSHSRNSSYNNENLDVEMLDEDGWRQIAKAGDIVELGRLGEGIGGAVTRCRLRNGKTIFALKEITTNPNPDIQKQIVRELQFNRECKSPHIVRYYGTFLNEESANIFIAMEYCGGGSLDAIYKRVRARGGRIGEKVLAKVADGVLSGLSYLHDRRIIHRDIKPQNILLDSEGQVKLCDFGVSGEVVNSLATTFTGTSYYMAPERIQGQPYSVTSDVWSLGLTLMEVAQHRFPFLPEQDSDQQPLMPIELLTFIVNMPAPELHDEPAEGIKWSDAFRHFLSCCLEKDPKKRASPRQMLGHPWLVGQRNKTVRMDKFVKECWT